MLVNSLGWSWSALLAWEIVSDWVSSITLFRVMYLVYGDQDRDFGFVC